MQDKIAAVSSERHTSAPSPTPMGESARAPRMRQRQRLIDACIAALHLYGPSRTTVEKVVAIANLSPGIVRFYFDSKDAMLVASLAYLAAEFEERVLAPVARLKSTPARALERLVELYLDPEIASPRKVSVWYSFWGEASSRQEYHDICGKKDDEFAGLVRELIEAVMAEAGLAHLDADAISLGLIGVLEVLWQGIAFQNEENIDRAAARHRSLAYLGSVFPGMFPAGARPDAGPRESALPPGTRTDGHLPGWAYANAAFFALERERLFRPAWQVVGLAGQLRRAGAFITAAWPWERVLVVRDTAGMLHALRNACRRQPHALLEEPAGRIADKLRCAAHDLTYDLDGRLLAGATPGDLTALELTRLGPLLLVRSPPVGGQSGAGGLAAITLDAWPALHAVRTEAVVAAADWKLIVEQWIESAVPGRHFLPPNQLLDFASEPPQILQALPQAAGRTRVVRFELRGARRARRPDRRGAGPAGLDLAAEIALAESAQRGLEALPGQAQDAGPLTPELARFRHSIAMLLPLLAPARVAG